jgi:hypothetical protein
MAPYVENWIYVVFEVHRYAAADRHFAALRACEMVAVKADTNVLNLNLSSARCTLIFPPVL